MPCVFQKKKMICDKKYLQGELGCQLILWKCFLQIFCAYMHTTVILFQSQKLRNITRLIYCKNSNSCELFEILLTKICAYILTIWYKTLE